MNEVYFVWAIQNGKPYPAKWYGSMFSSTTNKEIIPPQKHLLKDQERNLTLNELAEKYPFIKEEKSDGTSK